MIGSRIIDDALIKKIRSVLDEEDAIIFIGSGISMWSKLPSWNGLIHELAKHVELEGYNSEDILYALNNDLLQAASIGCNKLTKQSFKKFIKKICRDGIAVPHEIHSKIVNLGPTCFITTNFDRLIENAFYNLFDKVLEQVTNRQLTECTTIMQARARNFIFKPHGDLGDIDSIILTNEQYQSLYGDKNYILKTLETLFLTRTVVFMGFGLKDPDFISIMNSIKATYKDRSFVHYAIMPNMTESQIEFWKKDFGIRVLSYDTIKHENGEKTHLPLIEILDKLLEYKPHKEAINADEREITARCGVITDSDILCLIRYASGNKFNLNLSKNMKFPLNAMLQGKNKYKIINIDELLERTPENFILVGKPGAGKTFALKEYYDKLSDKVKEWGFIYPNKIEELKVPIYIDLKMYDGDLRDIIESRIPQKFPLDFLIDIGEIVFLLDSLNEVPRKFIESGIFNNDLLNFLKKANKCKIVIGSRSEEGLKSIGFDIYYLEEIDDKFIVKFCNDNGTSLNNMFKREIILLLQKPFYFRLFSEKKVELTNDSTPTDLYKSFFKLLSQEFEKNFYEKTDISLILKSIAYYAINEGSEVLNLYDVYGSVKMEFRYQKITGIGEVDFVNWLIEKQHFFIPLPNSKLAFFHQSVTEYLAALELSILYTVSPQLLQNCLKYTRWDNAIFLTTGFIKDDEAIDFLRNIIEKDIILAIKASKYLEFGQDKVVSEILNQILNLDQNESYIYESDIAFTLPDLTVIEHHEEQVRQLMRRKNYLGGIASQLLVKIKGELVKDELIDEIFDNYSNFNYVKGIGQALKGVVPLKEAVSLIFKIKDNYEEDAEGLASGIKEILSFYRFNDIIESFYPLKKLNEVQLKLLSSLLYENDSIETLNLIFELIEGGNTDFYFNLYCLLTSHEELKDYSFSTSFLNKTLEYIKSGINEDYIIPVLDIACKNHCDLVEIYNKHIVNTKGKDKLILLYSIKRTDEFWIELLEYIRTEFDFNNTSFIRELMDIIWNKNDEVFREIIINKNFSILTWILDGFRLHNKELELSIDTILDILVFVSNVEIPKRIDDYLLCILGECLAKNTRKEIVDCLIDSFNNIESEYRQFLGNYFISQLDEITTDSLTVSAINFLFKQVYTECLDNQTCTFGKIATESFIENKIIPLIGRDEEPLLTNIELTLHVAGNRHRRRYL